MSIQHVAAVLDCRDPRLASCKKLVLIALANRTDQAGQCWPSQELLAGECGIGTRTLRDHLLALETDGFIVRETTQFGQGKGARTFYRIVLSALKSAPEEIAAAKFAPEVFDTCTGGTPPPKSNLQEPSLDDDDSASANKSLKVKCGQWANDTISHDAHGFSRIADLMDMGDTSACTEADIEAGILKAASWLRSNGKVAKSFGYFCPSIIAARDERLNPAPPPAPRAKAKAATNSTTELDRMLAARRKQKANA